MPIAFDREGNRIPLTGSGVAASAGGIAVGGEIKGSAVIGNGKVVEVKSDKTTPNLAELADDLDNQTHKKTEKDFTKEELAEILKKLELIKDISPTTYQDITERLGYKVEDAEDKVANTGTGAIVSGRGKVAAGEGGIAVPDNFKGNIVMGEKNKFK